MSKKIELTKSQADAVNSRNHTLLVSAAAGSGKTAVLTKRIIKLVTDKDNPINVSDLLVVTFTKAAATELRERISKAIYEALQQNPSDKHLSKQLLMLGSAKICTIHSFCFDFIKKNFQTLGLPSSIRIADETETSLICNNVLNELIEECYGGLHSQNIPNFEEFSESFLLGKTDNNLAVDFADIYNSLRNYPQGVEVLLHNSKELLSSADENIFETKWGSVIKRHITRTIEYYYSNFKDACDLFFGDDVFASKYLPAFEDDVRFCFSVLQALKESSYNKLYKLFSDVEFMSLKSVKEEQKTEEAIFYQYLRNEYKSDIKKIKDEIFSFSEKYIREHFVQTAEINKTLYEFLLLFEERYQKEKIKRGLLDYNDLERLTLKLLYTDSSLSCVSEIARNVQEKYKYIFIDEYQDVNELQDKIFTAVSTPKNRFMVGDIKQSIYGFRGSEPTLFSNYRNAFPEYKGEDDESDGVTIFLSDNFRSNRTVLDFSNAVFDVLFNNNSGQMPYTKEDKLVCSRIYSEDEKDYDVRMCFLNDDELTKGYIREAELVANEIQSLIKQGTDPSDIALLFRSKKRTIFFEDALKRRNIQCFNQVDRGFFENDAVLLMLCLLNAIDNPSRDIYLAGVMKSPIFNFTMNEITTIRVNEKNGSLYNAVKKYAKENNCDKCNSFLSRLNSWRKYAEGCPVDKLVRYIYNETHIVELLSGKMDNDSDIERQANLLLLYEYAMQFENGSFKGLYNFILYLNDVLDKNTQLGNAKITAEGKGVVNIMSVHNSKGLEFDTVFLCDTGSLLNKNDEKKNYILSKELGLTLKLRDSTSFGRFDPFTRIASKYYLKENALDEELRVLYVALTRAKKRLIITSSLKKVAEKVKDISIGRDNVSQFVLLNANTLSELILWGILNSDYSDYSLELVDYSSIITSNEDETVVEKVYDSQLIEEYKNIIKDRLEYKYPNEELTVMPTKLSVSKLYPGVLDEYATDVDISVPSMYTKPKFLLSDNNRATGAERGTATHVFMQFCDFTNVQKNSVENEISRMIEKGFIDRKTAELINVDKVKSFFKCDLFNDILKAKKVWREKRFTIKLPATQFMTDKQNKEIFENEKILVQGVIDLLYENDKGEITLLDYKTDWFSDSDIESGKAEKTLIERHKTQLTYYAEACKKLLGKDVNDIVIYSFALGKEIKIK